VGQLRGVGPRARGPGDELRPDGDGCLLRALPPGRRGDRPLGDPGRTSSRATWGSSTWTGSATSWS
jgi:hypothetical protein